MTFILKKKINTLNDVQIINLQTFSDETGRLVVMESGESLNMTIKRVFTVLDHKDILRGRHAHKECTQILVCQDGICQVLCDDGKQKKCLCSTIPVRDSIFLNPSGLSRSIKLTTPFSSYSATSYMTKTTTSGTT